MLPKILPETLAIRLVSRNGPNARAWCVGQ
jgi:hypothetical protein